MGTMVSQRVAERLGRQCSVVAGSLLTIAACVSMLFIGDIYMFLCMYVCVCIYLYRERDIVYISFTIYVWRLLQVCGHMCLCCHTCVRIPACMRRRLLQVCGHMCGNRDIYRGLRTHIHTSICLPVNAYTYLHIHTSICSHRTHAVVSLRMRAMRR